MASGDIPVQFVEAAGMFGMFFSKTVVKDFDEAKASNVEFFKKYYMEMLQRGIYLAPSAFEAFFISAAHTYEDLDRTIEAHKNSILFLSQILV
jgi:glutamate-1-semialdehyde 2,1-aminomutase